MTSDAQFAMPLPSPDATQFRHSSHSLRVPLYLSAATPTEKEFDPYTLAPPEDHFRSKHGRDLFRRARGFLSIFSHWAFLVIAAQLCLVAFGWGFYIAVQARGQIALPASLAEHARANPHSTTIIVTLIATCLSGVSAYLFAHALRRSLALSLYRPISLAALRATVSISTRTVVFNWRDLKWTALSLLFFIIAGVQTTGWSTLLTPVPIVLSTPLVGTEVDFTNDVFLEYSKSGLFDNCFQSDLFSQVTVDNAESGLAAAQAVVGYPASFNFNYRSYNVSTGGILPAYLDSVPSAAGLMGNETIPATTRSVKPLPKHAISTNYSMVHQGLTADVSCTAVPHGGSIPLNFNTSQAILDGVPSEVPYYAWYAWMDGPCDGMWNETQRFTDPNNSTVIALSCDNPNEPYKFWVLGRGIYNYISGFSCTVWPKISTVNADYTSSGSIYTNLVQTTNNSDFGGPAGVFAFSTIMNAFYVGQGVSADVFGNHISSVARAGPSSQWTDVDLMERILSAYFRGVVEFSGSLLRTCISETLGPFTDGVPANITHPTTGVFRTETLGWSFTTPPTRAILLPTTLLALASIAVIAAAWVQNPGQMHRRMEFDATNPLHLLAAAAAGGLGDTFKGLGSRDIRDGEKTVVILGPVQGRRTGLMPAQIV